MKSVFNKLAERLDAKGNPAGRPDVPSFRAFLETQAKVRLGEGRFGPYSFSGREALLEIVDTIDLVLGSKNSKPLTDASIDICGGAQFGKTILALNLGAYITSCLYRSWGYYLPDDDLVENIVDGKFRPEVVDQIDWLASAITLGKTVNKSGKAVNRKGAFMVSSGGRTGLGMIRGMGKIPTSFTMDVVMEDEKDDIPASRSKFLRGRMTSSDLRLKMSIGTQRIHGAGQNRQFEDGSQHVMMLSAGHNDWINPEEHWPQICRLAVTGVTRTDDPQLTWEGDFKDAHDKRHAHKPGNLYYLADPGTGLPMDRGQVRWVARRPERVEQRKWSYRISQLGIAAIDLSQIVSAWQDAIRDTEDMVVFCCDRLAMPKSAAQSLSPKVLARARSLEPFDMGLGLMPGTKGFGGVDTGDRCWMFVREVANATTKRARRVEQIAAGNLVSRVSSLFHTMGLSALFIDSRPLINEARTLCFILNGLVGINWPKVPDPEHALIQFPGGLTWDGPSGRWKNLKCAAVEFTLKPGQGIKHKLGQCEQDGQTAFYPIIQCCRFDVIDRAVCEFLTAEENVIQVVDGKMRTEPVMRLPRREAGSPSIIETLDNHLLTGSQRSKDKDGVLSDYVDQVENHLLLANAYSGLAERVVEGSKQAPFAYEPVKILGHARLPRQKGVLV